MEKKKLTREQLERKLRSAVVFVPNDKETKSIYFSDKGLRLTHTMDSTVIATGAHRHVFSNINTSGFSRPAMYIERVIDIALKNEPIIEDSKGNKSYSFSKLLEALGNENDHSEFYIVTYVSWWLQNIFSPLYQISEDAPSQFVTFFNYMSNVATQHIFLSEHKEGMTNKQFAEEHDKLMKEFLAEVTEASIFEPLSDEERLKQEIEALQEQEAENAISQEANGQDN